MLINHEEVIMEAFVRMLTRAGETEPEKVARKNINNFKRDHVIQFRESSSIPVGESVSRAQLAQYVSEKYPVYDLEHYKKEAGSKKNQYDLDMWWSKFQERAHRDLNSDDDFTALAKHVALLRTRLRVTEEAATEAPQATKELVIDIKPGELAVNDNFRAFADEWRREMQQADFIPQAEGDLKVIRANEKKCKEVEEKINSTLQEIAKHLELALKGDPEVKKYTDRLLSLREEMQALYDETRKHRINASKMPKKWLDDQKTAAVTEHLERVNALGSLLFGGEILCGRNDTDARARLIAAHKGRRTVETIFTAVEAEADLIISEMEARAKLCHSNLKLIEESGRPALFQDKVTLMVWDPEKLQQEIKLRVQQEALLKAQAKRNPEKLAEWKHTLDQIDNVPHLENWYNAHWAEVKASMPHEEDQNELLTHRGTRMQQLKRDFAKAMNEPPPPEDQEMVSAARVETSDERRGDEAALQEEVKGGQEETKGSKEGELGNEEGYTASFEVFVPGTDPKKANLLFRKVWELVEEMGGIPSEIK